MKRLTLCIGGHRLSVSGDSASFFERYVGCRPFFVEEDESEWEVCYDEPLVPWNGLQELSDFSLIDTGGRCRFGRQGDGYQFEMFAPDGDRQLCMQYHAGSRRVEATSCSDVSALRFSLWFAVSLLMPLEGLTFVHSSTVVCHDRAVLFLGESGTGKSTHSRLWMQHVEGVRLLNDDSPILSIGQNENRVPCIFGSPWSGKTPCYHAADFPLAAVVRLSQAKQNTIRQLRTVEAFAALQPSLPPALMQDADYADRLIEILSRTLAAVPFYHLECLPDAAAAQLCHDTVFGL